MVRQQSRTADTPAMKKLAWILPTILAILLVETGRYMGVSNPVPFFIIFICVVITGSQGGQQLGLIAGAAAAAFVIYAYFQQFGPQILTGSVQQTVFGSIVFLLIGFSLGRLKDQRDAIMWSFRESEKMLASALKKETAEKIAQAVKVAEREASLDTAIRIAGIGHFSFDSVTGDCTYCSEQHAKHFGLTPDEYATQTKGRPLRRTYMHADDRRLAEKAISKVFSGEPQTFDIRAKHPNGEIRYINQIVEPVIGENGKVRSIVGTSIDLTELREAEARVRQSQRIEAIGTLTGGVAHDFNNLLAVILGNLELSLETKHDDDRKELIGAAISATMRGGGLTKNLLSFARRAHLEPMRMNLNQTIQNTMAWGARVLPATINIENSLMAELWDVELDATSTENALINILLNARDAMPDGGKVTIETANIWIGDEYISDRDEEIEPGRYVMLSISDTGHGIPSDKIGQVFEPFYTDKPVGEGSGLGLSMVQGFIKQSDGAIRIYSEVGVGTTIKLYLKAAKHEADKPVRQVSERPLASKGHAEILVVEDEIEVMRILKRILEGAEYSVTTAGSGDEALEVFQSGGRFDLLLTDVVMPGELQGPALAKAIRSIDPNIPCIFLSGYASEATVHGNGLKPSDIRLMKPVSRSDLLIAVSKALEPEGEIE